MRLVEEVRKWAESQAEDAVDWYLRDKAIKRFGSRALRAVTVALFAAGGIAPLVNVARTGEAGGWGYVLLAAAAACAAFDHFFGVSSAWMRDMRAAQALQRRLTEFRLTWTLRLVGSCETVVPAGDRDGAGGAAVSGAGGAAVSRAGGAAGSDADGDDPAGGAAVGAEEAELAERLELVRAFIADMTGVVEAETAEWLAEFRSNMGNLYSQVGLARPADQ